MSDLLKGLDTSILQKPYKNVTNSLDAFDTSVPPNMKLDPLKGNFEGIHPKYLTHPDKLNGENRGKSGNGGGGGFWSNWFSKKK